MNDDRRTKGTSPFAHHWTLDAGTDFLNHGSYGACPRAVLEAQSEMRALLERNPLQFFLREYPRLHEEARARLAAFVNADAVGLVPVANATTAVNAALAAHQLGAGDEILVTDHAYNACRCAAERVARDRKARVAVAHLPLPLTAPDDSVAAILDAVGPRTRVALIDHVTSKTGLVLPIETIVRELRERGVETIVDGAHAPGMVALDLSALGAAHYAGNCHKWMCAPKGAGFLHVREDLRDRTEPGVISHGWNASDSRSRFELLFEWSGTDDPTAFLCVPAAIDFLGGLLPGGWDELRRRNRALALRGKRILEEALDVAPICPDAMIGSIASVRLPPSPAPANDSLYATDPDQDTLYFDHGIEVPLTPFPRHPERLLRISAQLYNSEDQYRSLAAAITEIVRG